MKIPTPEEMKVIEKERRGVIEEEFTAWFNQNVYHELTSSGWSGDMPSKFLIDEVQDILNESGGFIGIENIGKNETMISIVPLI